MRLRGACMWRESGVIEYVTAAFLSIFFPNAHSCSVQFTLSSGSGWVLNHSALFIFHAGPAAVERPETPGLIFSRDKAPKGHFWVFVVFVYPFQGAVCKSLHRNPLPGRWQCGHRRSQLHGMLQQLYYLAFLLSFFFNQSWHDRLLILQLWCFLLKVTPLWNFLFLSGGSVLLWGPGRR